MSFLTIHNEFKNCVTGMKSPRIFDLFEDVNEVHVDTSYIAKSFRRGNFNTLLKEVVLLPYEEVLAPEWFSLMKIAPQTKPTSLEAFIDKFVKTITDSIEATWRPEKFHIIYHSGGWDSRILSAIISEIRDRRGDNFIGKILFVCWGEECRLLDEIMQIEGWNKSQYVVLPRDDDFFAYHLNFVDAYYRLNGSCSYPMNPKCYFIDKLQSHTRGFDIDYYSAGYFNEVFKYIQGKGINAINVFLSRYYYSWSTKVMSIFPDRNKGVILNQDTLEHVIQSKIALPGGIREKILIKINPKLHNIPRLSNQRRMSIPEKFIKRMTRDYFSSFYGSKIKPNAIVETKLRHSVWWSEWSSASLIQNLVNDGIKIKF